jgi:Flp pilus assembly protein TadB
MSIPANLPVVVAVACSGGAIALVSAPWVRRVSIRRLGCDDSSASGRTSTLDLIDVIESLSRHLRSGRSLRDALTTVLADAATLLPEVRTALSRQAPVADALAAHTPRADERDLLVHALRLGAQHTHVIPEVLDRAAVVIRERRTWRNERVVQAAQARSSARVLTFLPLAFAVWGVATSSSVRAAYAGSIVTVSVAGIGIALNAVGWWWMRRAVGVPR